MNIKYSNIADYTLWQTIEHPNYNKVCKMLSFYAVLLKRQRKSDENLKEIGKCVYVAEDKKKRNNFSFKKFLHNLLP